MTVIDLDQARRDRGTVRELYAHNACKGTRCRAGIRWVPTVKTHPRTGARLLSGAPIPLELDRDPHGSIVLDLVGDEWRARPVDYADPADTAPTRPRYALHWTGCHHPDLYRTVKADADPRGILPALQRAGAASSHWPPCPVCKGPNRGETAMRICLGCTRKAVARWSTGMLPTVRAWPTAYRELVLVDTDAPIYRAWAELQAGDGD